MTSYAELLKDPRWQRKRLEVMERDNFTCRWCGADDKTLNIHHLHYIKGRKPWEYENDDLLTVCEGCHKDDKGLRGNAEAQLVEVLKMGGWSSEHLQGVANALDSLGIHQFRVDGVWNVHFGNMIKDIFADPDVFQLLVCAYADTSFLNISFYDSIKRRFVHTNPLGSNG